MANKFNVNERIAEIENEIQEVTTVMSNLQNQYQTAELRRYQLSAILGELQMIRDTETENSESEG